MNETSLGGARTVAQLRELAYDSGFEVVDASVGSPVDPPPAVVPHLLASSGVERHYPRSDGSPGFKDAALAWLLRSAGVALDVAQVGATIGSKEFITTLPAILAHQRQDRDVVLVPSIAYPSYAVGARWAGLEVYPMPLGADGGPDFGAIPEEVAVRALLAWVNSPNNPTGAIYDLAGASRFGERHGVIIASDECYRDFGWSGQPGSLLEFGTASHIGVFSLSKRSNLAGLRIGIYAGDTDLIREIAQTRRELGLMPPGPVQAVAARIFEDEEHVLEQRRRYLERLELLAGWMSRLLDTPVSPPQGGIYLWVPATAEFNHDGTALARMLASKIGLVVAPGENYGDPRFVRIAATISSGQMEALAPRMGSAG